MVWREILPPLLPPCFLLAKLCSNPNPFSILLRFQILLPPFFQALAAENSLRSSYSGQTNLFVRSRAQIDTVGWASPLSRREAKLCHPTAWQERGSMVWVESWSCSCIEADQLWVLASLSWVPCPEGGGAGSLRNWVFFPGFWVTTAAFQCSLKSTSRKLLIGSWRAH